jgi:acetoin utilization deacetylase AcuC-like enzyme
MRARTAIVHSPHYACDIGPHVFPMVKFRLLRERLIANGEVAAGEILEPGAASPEELLRVHTRAYLDDLEALRVTERTLFSELPLTAEIVGAYTYAAGGTTLAAREALARGAGVNLGGGFHHAGPERAEGFCYLNDLAVAARALQHERRVGRVAIVDLDVHQGNGTAWIFHGDPDVFTLSIHQENNYPVPKAPSTLDLGLADGTGDAEYLARLDEALERVWAFDPALVLYQAGADPYHDDLLGGLELSFAGLEARDRRVLEGCAERGIPSATTLGGGYARQLEDTIRIHLATCRVALEIGARAGAPGKAGSAPGRAP